MEKTFGTSQYRFKRSVGNVSESKIPMSKLECGQKAKVAEINPESSNCSFRKRLTDMGLLPGSSVECKIKCVGSACYCIHNALIAIADSALKGITVIPEEKDENQSWESRR